MSRLSPFFPIVYLNVLQWFTPLFRDIEAGKICPPQIYEFGNALGKDNSFYETDKPFHKVEADFVSALEDWESQEWYQQLTKSGCCRACKKFCVNVHGLLTSCEEVTDRCDRHRQHRQHHQHRCQRQAQHRKSTRQ